MAVRNSAPILCVDDYQSILDGWKVLLESEGYQVLIAVDSNPVLQLFASQLGMKLSSTTEVTGVSGDEVAREVRAMKPTVATLMLSGDDSLPKDKLKLVDAFLFKADSIAVFLDVIKTLLNKSNTARTSFAASDLAGMEEERVLDHDALDLTANAAA